MKPFTEEDKARIKQAWVDPSVLEKPEELHALARNWNWDGGLAPLFGIIRNPNCDKGTALLVYWYAAPVYHYQKFGSEEEIPHSHERELYSLIKEVEIKYLSGFYTRESIQFDPATDWQEPYQGEVLEQPIPEIMLQPSPGEKLSFEDLWLDPEW